MSLEYTKKHACCNRIPAPFYSRRALLILVRRENKEDLTIDHGEATAIHGGIVEASEMSQGCSVTCKRQTSVRVRIKLNDLVWIVNGSNGTRPLD